MAKLNGRALSVAAVKKLRDGQTVYHREYTQGGGNEPMRFRVVSRVKTWKRDKNRVEVSLRHGLKDNVRITNPEHSSYLDTDLTRFTLTEWTPKAAKKSKGRRASGRRAFDPSEVQYYTQKIEGGEAAGKRAALEWFKETTGQDGIVTYIEAYKTSGPYAAFNVWVKPKRPGRRAAACKTVKFTTSDGERVSFKACGGKGRRNAGQRVKNSDVAAAWGYGRSKAAGHFRTDGRNLYSYNLLIGETVGGRKVLYEYTSKGMYRSNTTSTHVGRARPYADVVKQPK